MMQDDSSARPLCGLPLWLIGRMKKLVHSVIDSGASANAIPYALARDIGYKINTRNRQTVYTGNGETTMVGTIDIPCSSGEYYLGVITFHVSKVDIPILLGIGFLEDYSDSVSFKHREMRIGDSRIPLIDFNGTTGCIKKENLDDELIKKILVNIVNNPRDDRFKKLSLASKILNDAQYSTLLYLQNIGFKNDHTHLIFVGYVDDLRDLI
jgi:hypothetical protein